MASSGDSPYLRSVSHYRPRPRRLVLNGSRRLWRAAGPVRFVARRLNTSSIRPPRASRPGLLAPPGLGPPFNTSLLEDRVGSATRKICCRPEADTGRAMYHQRLATVRTPVPENASHPASSGRRAALCLVVILAGLYVPMFFGRIIFTRDIAHWIFPARWLVYHTLRSGELPLWNPCQGLGFPVLGDPLYGVFYPPNWLLLLFSERWLANGLTVLDFLHMAWGGLGAYALARRLRATPTASLVAGLAWSLSGYMTSQWTAGLRLHAGAWIPWVAVGHLALLDDLRAGGRRFLRGIAKAALPTGMALLMGEIFLAIMGVVLAAVMVLVVQVSERRDDSTTPAYR